MPHSHIPIMFNFTLHVCTIFSHGEHWCASWCYSAPSLNTTPETAEYGQYSLHWIQEATILDLHIVYDCIHGLCYFPPDIVPSFPIDQIDGSFSTNPLLLNAFYSSFVPHATNIWNTLPERLVTSSFSIFYNYFTCTLTIIRYLYNSISLPCLSWAHFVLAQAFCLSCALLCIKLS